MSFSSAADYKATDIVDNSCGTSTVAAGTISRYALFTTVVAGNHTVAGGNGSGAALDRFQPAWWLGESRMPVMECPPQSPPSPPPRLPTIATVAAASCQQSQPNVVAVTVLVVMVGRSLYLLSLSRSVS